MQNAEYKVIVIFLQL